jgi:hypothetical protein
MKSLRRQSMMKESKQMHILQTTNWIYVTHINSHLWTGWSWYIGCWVSDALVSFFVTSLKSNVVSGRLVTTVSSLSFCQIHLKGGHWSNLVKLTILLGLSYILRNTHRCPLKVFHHDWYFMLPQALNTSSLHLWIMYLHIMALTYSDSNYKRRSIQYVLK